MMTQISPAKNYLYELLKKKYHTSEVIRTQIDELREKSKEQVTKETKKFFVVRFKGQVIDTSFEKTLKIISKRLFMKGKINNILTFKEQGLVESNITATVTEIESLITCLKKSHVVLHYKKSIERGASNLLIIDETEEGQLGNFMPDYIHRNYITSAESCEKYTGRLGEYLILHGLPLTSEKIGRELRFNKIETKNRVFTTTGLKEIYVNLHFISLILKLDLEQHYLKLRIFNSQENDIKRVEEKIDVLGFFADIFNHIATTDNPLLSNQGLFLDLMRLEHIIENNNWKAMPAYAGYVYSAANRLNMQFKLLEEYSLFLTYSNCIEKFIARLAKKLSKHKPDFSNEQENLTANYNELKKLQIVSNHPLLQSSYHDLLNSFSKLLAYLDFLTIRNTKTETADSTHSASKLIGKFPKKFGTIVKKCIESIFSVTIDISPKPAFRQDPVLKTGQEEGVQKLMMKFNENLEKLSKLKTTTGSDAFLEARKCVPLMTSLSDILDQLKELIKTVESKKEPRDTLSAIFAGSNKFEILYKELGDWGIVETSKEQETAQGILRDLQKLLFDKPLKESKYPEIINTIHSLEDFIISKTKSATTIILTLHQNPAFSTLIDIKTGLQNVTEKGTQMRKIDTFKNEPNFFSYSETELEDFLAQSVKFHEELKGTCYYKNISEFEVIEKKLDRLIDEVKNIEDRISSHTRNKDQKISREPNIQINYLKGSQLMRKNLEKAILLLQNQITQIEGFMHNIESNLYRQSFIHSGVATSVLFDQTTYLLSNIDVRLIDLPKSAEDMFNESVNTIFHYQVGEIFKEPKIEDIEDLMKEIDRKAIVRKF